MRAAVRKFREPMPADVRAKHGEALRGRPKSAAHRRALADVNRIDGVSWRHGRAWVYLPSHPAADKHGRVRRARAVMEAKIGRLLTPNELVHHINIDCADDHQDNLMVMTRRTHTRLHQLLRSLGIEDHFQQWFAQSERAA